MTEFIIIYYKILFLTVIKSDGHFDCIYLMIRATFIIIHCIIVIFTVITKDEKHFNNDAHSIIISVTIIIHYTIWYSYYR